MKFILSFLLVLTTVTASFAQDEAKMPKPDTKSGTGAWMFEIGGLGPFGMDALYIAQFDVAGTIVDAPINTSSFPVLGAGGKYYISDGMALKAILAFSTSSKGDADLAKDPSGKTTLSRYGIVAGIEMHTHPVYSTSPYFGAQVSFAGLSESNSQTPTGGKNTETKSSGTAIGIGAVAGFDWFVTNGIAVGGEYMLGFTTSSTSSTSATGTTTDNPSITSIGISSVSVHLVVVM